MRPKAIATFERLGLLSVMLSAVQVARLGVTGRMSGIEAAVGAGGVLVSVALVLLASRKRSKIALWVLTAFTMLGVAAAAYAAGGGGIDAAQVVDFVSIALQAAAVAMAWTGAAREWFAGADVKTV